MSKTYIIRRNESIHKFVDAAVERHDKSGESQKDHGEWAGATFEDAVRFAKYGGWEPDGAIEFRRLFDELVPKLRKFTGVQMERFMQPVGDQVDIAAFVNGEPDHMWDWVPQETQVTNRALCLVVGHSISAGCTADELFIRGQALIGLVRALSLFGFELEIWSELTVGPSWGGDMSKAQSVKEDYFTTLTRIHAAGEIMDESAVEFAIGNPSWLRRLNFAFEEGESGAIRAKFGFIRGGGYGRPEAVHHAGLLNADLHLSLGHTWFGERGQADEYTAKHAVDWVVGQLRELGVLPEDAEIDWS